MVFGGHVMSAQGKYGADSAECIKYLSYYKEYYKSKNYDSALPNWRKAYSLCPPTANQTMLVDGTTLVRKLITKNAANAEYRNALIDTLFSIHRTRAEYYPKYKVVAMNNLGFDMANFYKNDPQKLFEGLNEVIAANKELTKPSVLLIDLNAAIQMYQDNELDADALISVYQNNMAYLEQAVPTDANAKEDLEKVKDDMESLFISSKVASCEKILEVYTPRYEAAPEDLALEAVKYIAEALTYPDISVETAADYNYEAATFCVKNGKNAKALEFANKSMELADSYKGKAYFLIGTIWGATTCGGDEISRRAPYWVAYDYMAKAKDADPSLAEDCNRMMSQYRVYFPQTAEAFMYDLTDGKPYKVSCNGMTANTTVRTQK